MRESIFDGDTAARLKRLDKKTFVKNSNSMSTTSTPGGGRPSRKIKPNPVFSPQPGILATMGKRDKAALASSRSASPALTKKRTAQLENTDQEDLEETVKSLRSKVQAMEEENQTLKEAVRGLTSRLEAEEETRRLVEVKFKTLVEESEVKVGKMAEGVEECKKIVKEVVERSKKEIKEVEERSKTEIKEVEERSKKELKEVEERVRKVENPNRNEETGVKEVVGGDRNTNA